MSEKRFPLDRDALEALARRFPTPFHLYDEAGMRRNARAIREAFAGVPGFIEHFAVKALPNPFILRILASEGFGADCSSLPELLLCECAGITGDKVMFTSNETPDEEFRKAYEMGAILNLDDVSHVEALERALGGKFPETICVRYNPGPARGGNDIIGKPEEAKYGMTREQVFEAFAAAREKGAKRFGLHTMVISNERNTDYHVETARMIFRLAVDVKRELGIAVAFANNGGGLGIPYRPEEEAADSATLAAGVRQARRDILEPAGLGEMGFRLEWGRCITGPYGWLVTRAIRHKDIYRKYIGVDASMANLMRPGMYGAYHHVTVAGKENAPADHVYDVVGSLCENCDKFAVARALPRIDEGDLVVIHDTGAHGHAMGFNYNGKLRSAELLLRENGDVVQIRRAETPDDLFSTLDLAAASRFA